MKPFPPALRNATVTYGRADLVVVSLIAAVVAVWAAIASGAFSVRALLACEATFLCFYLVGSLLASWKALATGVLFDLPLRLLLGYAAVNTTLLALAWLSPLGIVSNFCALFGLAIWVCFACGERRQIRGNPAGFCAVGLCVVATSLWCQDSISPVSEQGEVVVFKPWADGFYHAVHVRIFGASHGASSIEDFRLAGVPARPYHYGMYLLPGFIKQVSGMASYAAFAGILAPVGVLFTGLAAYAFFGSLWGAWPGLAAAAALLLLPDGAQQGMQNTFMSYHWLTQISPSATYGLALLGLAWLFVVRACSQGSRTQLFAGWLFAVVLAAYKLHYVVASGLLLLLIPALFLRSEVSRRKRALWVALAGSAYAVALALGQRVPGVPLIRFDGSASGEILRLIQTFAPPGALRDYIAAHMGPRFPWTSNLLFGIPYVLFSMFGVSLLLFGLLLTILRKNVAPLAWMFPLFLIGNFLLMFFGLALDFDSSTPDELSHRPLMIVYFFVVGWVGGALGLMLVQARRTSEIARPVLIGSAAVLMTVPALLGPGVQLMWAMPRISPFRVPSSLVRVADYIRGHGGPEDVFQDSQFDRNYVIAALSERRTFVAHTMTRMPFRSEMVAVRSAAVDRLLGIRQPKLVLATARAFGVRWFVIHRGNPVGWPEEIANQPAFESGPFKLYEF